MKARLFIGNLASTVTEEELKGKFDALLASHKGEADVGNVEVRCKNENNYFGFVDVHLNQPGHGTNSAREDSRSTQAGGGKNIEIPIFLRKYIDLMNNTKWKGTLIKVQLAKESFIDKLRREQQESQKSESGGRNGSNYAQNGQRFDGFQTRNVKEENDSEQSRNQRQANDILYKLNRSNERRRRGDFEDQNAGTKKDSGNYGFEVVSSDTAAVKNKSPNPSPVKSSHPPTRKEKKSKKSKKYSSSEDEESDDDVRDGIPKFKGLLFCYPDGLPQEKPEETLLPIEEKLLPTEENIPDPEETQIQQKLLSIAFEKDRAKRTQRDVPTPLTLNSNKSTINFKKNKQQQSDLLRLQSIEKMKELSTQRKNVIKSALSSVTASAPVSKQRKILGNEKSSNGGQDDEREEPTHKRSKMALFDDDDSDNEQGDDSDDNKEAFKVKKQFEGASGQKLLELKTRWGNDDRFKIDDRFKDSDTEEAVEPMEQEKEKQYDILTGILGKVVSSKTAAVTQKKGSSTKSDSLAAVIMPRYDPEAENESGEHVQVEDEQEVDEAKLSTKSRKEKKNESTDSVAEKSIRSNEPATFKTVSNLRALFSSTTEDKDIVKEKTILFKTPAVATQQNNFSLLATFGKSGGDDDNDKNTEKSATTASKFSSKSAEVPRTFWQSNPFKYDSSDDEGDGDKVKVTIKERPEKPTPSPSLFVHGKMPFFFTENDARFNGLEDYFLRYEENSSTNEAGKGGADGTEVKKDPVEDFALKRQELKSIVKAKIRNTKRKDEKRTLAIKRAIRKRKSKVHQRGRKNFS